MLLSALKKTNYQMSSQILSLREFSQMVGILFSAEKDIVNATTELKSDDPFSHTEYRNAVSEITSYVS